MKTLYRIWHDIRRGENLDLYLTIAVSVVVSVLNLVGTAAPQNIPALTLAILALLAVSTLVSRYRVEDLTAKINPTIDNIFTHEFPNELKTEMETASELWLFGSTFSNFVESSTLAVFENRIKKGFKIRLLLINPDNENAINMAAMRSYRNDKPRLESTLRTILKDFCQLKEKAPDKVSIKTIDCLLGHRLIAINPESPVGKLYISHYSFQVPGSSRPKYVVCAKDNEWYHFFKEEANLLWKSATDWNCESTQ